MGNPVRCDSHPLHHWLCISNPTPAPKYVCQLVQKGEIECVKIVLRRSRRCSRCIRAARTWPVLGPTVGLLTAWADPYMEMWLLAGIAPAKYFRSSMRTYVYFAIKYMLWRKLEVQAPLESIVDDGMYSYYQKMCFKIKEDAWLAHDIWMKRRPNKYGRSMILVYGK